MVFQPTWDRLDFIVDMDATEEAADEALGDFDTVGLVELATDFLTRIER